MGKPRLRKAMQLASEHRWQVAGPGPQRCKGSGARPSKRKASHGADRSELIGRRGREVCQGFPWFLSPVSGNALNPRQIPAGSLAGAQQRRVWDDTHDGPWRHPAVGFTIVQGSSSRAGGDLLAKALPASHLWL
uniref:Uncharacterized protein n=1 Tax=Myotis myotis TaxID=51298 RepID=A0A7J7T5T9_MYOMY|nr:hypothetical protein mMyoMyo1_009136 [Myotis myotis]